MDDLELMARPAPTVRRPLLGMTILVVEDSRFACEAVRLLALRSGARLRRADSLRAARRHLASYRPDVVVVDLGLPDGPGSDLIADLSGAPSRPTVILATSGQTTDMVANAALEAGADGFLAKPIDSLAAFQQAILAHVPIDLRPPGPRPVNGDRISPDRLALSEDFAFADRALAEGRPTDYVAAFLEGLARTGHDAVLLAEAQSLAAQTAEDIRPRLHALIAERIATTRRAI
ncbi:response regulator [Jannaschia seohaensis]|uniref:Response regulator receiver domain-containing protein n=1 Tax=Jannaschia seohaensis TaxID=475081 RepID=A0A2Y9B0W0_9RHOB|nr:response regulator [Jannaschia seohaensis]PWJ14409.1 response regulator receiver domain-containing protein [Jannaschia seohaensis]SSA50130.1 Response regulator receiver domain-containing protein [Jannaschia seohaensis]